MTQDQIDEVRKCYVNKRVRLVYMEDFDAVAPGTLGTIDHVDDIGQLHMKWDNGRTLAINPETDRFQMA
jgi:hypothetical protein